MVFILGRVTLLSIFPVSFELPIDSSGGEAGATDLLLLGRVVNSSWYDLFFEGRGGGVSSSSCRASEVDLGASDGAVKSLAQSREDQSQ